MKTFWLSIFLIQATLFSFSQDIIYKKNKETINCKVTEISPTEIRYKDWTNLDGPTIVIYSDQVFKIQYQNGTETIIKPDALTVNQEAQIIEKKQAIKFAVFSPLNNNIGFSYERVLKLGINLETKIAYIGAGYKTPYDYTTQGAYFGVGAKFALGQDFYIQGMRYIHPLKGRFIKLELSYVYFTSKDHEFMISSIAKNKTDITYSSGGINLIYGRQFILGNLLTLDYYVGLGYGFSSKSFSNSLVKNDDFYTTTNYYSYYYFGGTMPLTFTSGLTIGYIF